MRTEARRIEKISDGFAFDVAVVVDAEIGTLNGLVHMGYPAWECFCGRTNSLKVLECRDCGAPKERGDKK